MKKINPNKIYKNMYKKSKKNIICKIAIILILLLLFLIATTIYVLKSYIYPLKHFDIVKVESQKNNLDPYLVLAIIKSESGFDKHATSNKQARGLMQIMDSTAEDIKNKMEDINEEYDIYNEEVNIALGCKYFSSLIEKYNGNYYLAICAYNAGMGNVDKWLEQNIISNDLNEYKNVNLPFLETKKYLYKVIRSYKMYRLIY